MWLLLLLNWTRVELLLGNLLLLSLILSLLWSSTINTRISVLLWLLRLNWVFCIICLGLTDLVLLSIVIQPLIGISGLRFCYVREVFVVCCIICRLLTIAHIIIIGSSSAVRIGSFLLICWLVLLILNNLLWFWFLIIFLRNSLLFDIFFANLLLLFRNI